LVGETTEIKQTERGAHRAELVHRRIEPHRVGLQKHCSKERQTLSNNVWLGRQTRRNRQGEAAHRAELVEGVVDLQEVGLEQHLQLLHVELAAVAAVAVAVAVQVAQGRGRPAAAGSVSDRRGDKPSKADHLGTTAFDDLLFALAVHKVERCGTLWDTSSVWTQGKRTFHTLTESGNKTLKTRYFIPLTLSARLKRCKPGSTSRLAAEKMISVTDSFQKSARLRSLISLSRWIRTADTCWTLALCGWKERGLSTS
jgi:hypothetical protein